MAMPTKVDELVLEKREKTLYCAQLHLMFSADDSAAISRDIGSELEKEGGATILNGQSTLRL